MNGQSRFVLRVALLALILLAASAQSALGAAVDFESSEGYSAGNLHGQPTSGNQWSDDDSAKIAVTSAQSLSGLQSILLDPGLATGKVSNELDVGALPAQFSVKFYWRPSGTTSGQANIYLTQFAGSQTSFAGPRIVFVASGSFYQIKYVENGSVQNIKLGMSPGVYEDNWWEVEVVGDISTRTFDFYLDGTLEGSDLGFRNTITTLATSLNYLGVEASNTGVMDHYFDDFQITRNAGKEAHRVFGKEWPIPSPQVTPAQCSRHFIARTRSGSQTQHTNQG